MQWRLVLWTLFILGWLAMLLHLWSAFATFPSAERLEQSRLVAIPTLRTVALLAGRSMLELAAVLALLWPWRARAYLARILVAAVLLATWFVLTTPLSLSAATWVHRRWLAAMVVALLAAAAVSLAASGARLLRARLRGGS
jgi:hypothetical protein